MDADESPTRLLDGGRPLDPVQERRALATLRGRLFGGDHAGATVSRYRILERLGSGGSGAVYAAYDPELDRKVAIKLLHAGSSEDDDHVAPARLLREAQAIAQIHHPNVVSVHDVGIATLADGSDQRTNPRDIFVVMELVDGVTLREWLRRRTRSVREISRAFVAAGHGLVAAHERGIIHRDFKPSNVMVAADDRVLVLDFGLARPSRSVVSGTEAAGVEADVVLTRTKTVMGTPAYMAPEQYRGEDVDARCDQFSFGVALYEAVSGTRPFYGKSNAEMLAARKRGVDPSMLASSPRWLRRIVMKALAYDPSDRYPSLAALVSALDRGTKRRRHRMVAGLVAVATVGSAAAGAYVWHTAGIRSCAAQASLAGIWDESTRRAGRERFVATGRGYADHTWDTVSRTLDAYASELSAQQRAACRAAASWSDEDPTTSARWTLCLDRRRERLRALTGLFAAADARVVDHAVEALGALPPIADCATPGTAENVLDDAARQRLAEIETELLRAATLRKAARYDEAAKAGHKALEAAREVGDRATEARARIELGRIALHTDESSHEDAERELHAALALAESIGDVETAVRALTMLVHTVGPVAGRYAEADRLADQAQAKLEFGRLGPALEGELAYEIGLLRYREHRFEDALAAYEDARRLQAHAHGPRHPSVARSLTEIGNVHVQQSRYSAAAPMFEQAMQIYAEQLGEEHPRANSARNGLAMIARHAGDLERSLALFTEILHVQRRTEGEMHLGNAVTLSNRSSVMQRLGREDEALADLDRALQIRDRALGEEHPAVARTLTNRAGLLGRLGRAEEAIPDLERASAIFERTLGEDSPALAITLATLGELHVASGRIDQGEQAYERAIEIIRAQRTADFQTLGQTYAMLGTGLIERGLRDRGMAALEQAIDAFERHDDSAVYLAAARFRLAQALWATDRRRARHLATRAHRVLAANEHDREDAQEVEAWLRAHGGTLGIEG